MLFCKQIIFIQGDVKMIANITKSIIELNAIHEEWKVILMKVDGYIKGNICAKESLFDDTIDKDKMLELIIFGKEYNDLIMRTIKVLSKFQINVNVLPQQITINIINRFGEKRIRSYICKNTLDVMKRQAQAVITLLKTLINRLESQLESEAMPMKYNAELLSLEDEIKKLPDSLVLYTEDIRKALNHFRRGCYLGSVMIAGRVVDVIIDKLKKKKGKDIDLDNAFRQLLGDKYKASEKYVDALRLYRNKYAHNVGTNPTIPESIAILAGSVYLLKKVCEKSILL